MGSKKRSLQRHDDIRREVTRARLVLLVHDRVVYPRHLSHLGWKVMVTGLLNNSNESRTLGIKRTSSRVQVGLKYSTPYLKLCAIIGTGHNREQPSSLITLLTALNCVRI